MRILKMTDYMYVESIAFCQDTWNSLSFVKQEKQIQ
jgi:hypothetical protein